jgi:glycosyltransferase involved in cell wall biosynthesis
MLISTIIPTIGRQTLSRAVCSVLDQGFYHDDFEVIVVNDSGKEMHDEEWQRSGQVRVIHTNRHNRSVARNTGAAIANGRYLHFLDDDDWIFPGAFESFWEATNNGSAAWYHGGFSLVDNSGDKIVDIFPDEANNCFIQLVSWEWLPLQASIVDADAFFKVGGFAMLESLKGGFEDIDLTRQIALYYDFMNIPKLVACIRAGDLGSTTNYMDMFIQNRQSRGKALGMPGAFPRLVSSAKNIKSRNDYWYGKISYYYLGSAVKNIREKRLFTAVSRVLHALANLFLAGSCVLKSDFWHGLTKPHFPRVWLAVRDSGKELYPNTQWN